MKIRNLKKNLQNGHTDASKLLLFIFVTEQSKNGRKRFYSILYMNLMLKYLVLWGIFKNWSTWLVSLNNKINQRRVDENEDLFLMFYVYVVI